MRTSPGRREAPALLVAQVRLRRLEVRPSRPAPRRRRGRPRPDPSAEVAAPASSSSRWMTRSHSLVRALAEVVVADAPLGVGEVQRRPVVVAERAPDRVVVVDRDRVVDPHRRRPRGGRCRRPARTGTRACARRRRPGRRRAYRSAQARTYGQRPQPVDAGVRPEVDERPRGRAAHPASAARSSASRWRRRSRGRWPSTGSDPARLLDAPTPSSSANLEDRVGERLRRLLGQVVPDAAVDRAVRVLAGELRRVGARRRDAARRWRRPPG